MYRILAPGPASGNVPVKLHTKGTASQLCLTSRGERIRTSDLRVPNAARCRAAPLPVCDSAEYTSEVSGTPPAVLSMHEAPRQNLDWLSID